MDIDLQISGMADVSRALEAAGPTLARKCFGGALRKAGQVLQTEISGRAPVKTDTSQNSNSLPAGALKSDIQIQVKTSEQGGIVSVGPSPETARVARWVELGHRLVSHGKNGSKKVVGHVPANPFMRSGFAAAGDAALEAFQQELINSLSVLESQTNLINDSFSEE